MNINFPRLVFLASFEGISRNYKQFRFLSGNLFVSYSRFLSQRSFNSHYFAVYSAFDVFCSFIFFFFQDSFKTKDELKDSYFFQWNIFCSFNETAKLFNFQDLTLPIEIISSMNKPQFENHLMDFSMRDFFSFSSSYKRVSRADS